MKGNLSYKKFLTFAVLAAISTTPVFAETANHSDSGKTIAKLSMADLGKQNTTRTEEVATGDAATEAAIAAARDGISEAAKRDAIEEQRKRVDNSSLATNDKEVKTITKAGGDKLEEAQAAGVETAIPQVQARYYTSLTEEELQKYIGKTITHIAIDGLDKASQPQFLALLQGKIGDAVSVEGISKDIANLGGSGVLSEITPVFTVVPEGVKVSYHVTVNPVVKGVSVEGNTVYKTDVLVQYLGVQPNTVLNTIAVGEKVQGINAAYQRDGYILAHVKDMAVDEKGILHVSVVEGMVERITPHGNKKTKDRVITREFNQKVGQPFNKFLVRRSVEKVYNLGFFDDVNVRLTQGSTEEAVNIEVDVLEHKTGTVTLGAGYSGSDGFVGVVEVGEENLRGTGDKVKVHWEFGGSAGYKNYSVSYLRPWLDNKGTSLGVTYYDQLNEYTDYNEEGKAVATYDRKSSGFNISLGRQTAEFTRDYVTLEHRNDKYIWDDKDSSGFRYDTDRAQGTRWNNHGYPFLSKGYIKNNFGTTNSISWQKVYDSRDNVYEPTRGKRLSTTLQWGGHGLGGDFNFYKFTGEARTYKKVGSKQVLAFRARLGWAQGDLPYSQLYTIGGSDSLRAYEDDQYRGKKMYNFTAEYRFPIWNKVSGALFTDLGDAWDAPNVPWFSHSKTFNASVGAGVRVTTPIGPVRIDYGISKNQNKFHFSFGGQF